MIRCTFLLIYSDHEVKHYSNVTFTHCTLAGPGGTRVHKNPSKFRRNSSNHVKPFETFCSNLSAYMRQAGCMLAKKSRCLPVKLKEPVKFTPNECIHQRLLTKMVEL